MALSLLMEEPAQEETSSFQYPLLRFLAVLHIQKDGTWCEARNCTPNFAKLQWGFRCVMVREVLKVMNAMKGMGKTRAEIKG